MITIVGASLPGLTAARELRLLGWDTPITVIGDERWLLYDRPPRSKNAPVDGSVDCGDRIARGPGRPPRRPISRAGNRAHTAGPTYIFWLYCHECG